MPLCGLPATHSPDNRSGPWSPLQAAPSSCLCQGPGLRLPLPPSMGSLSLRSLGVFILTNPLNLGPEQITIPQLSLSATCPREVTTPLTAFLGGERLGYKQVRGSYNTGLRFLTPCNAETEPVESALFPYGREPLPTPCPTLLLKPRLEDRTGVEFE